ncbi:glutamyl-tRNA(Gln) amidotransferase subunit C [Spiroplasma litorale]|uniref:Glutamyl-tRNA(Gln) amidotransferase subunit C n=1 Tax=Spiroplasma litorale TaxID=216942 RepID=A0A0K1W0F0_9MOLU|nr:Asp-tRNA(Asn)/Glu-tRNA(Gln) amidotransferase subunit GatC [Spiroplasma litorale]AKX33774.1 glutamyl-tRNA(Gln) amidotransferase subunit C [Spiroplasma litorale]
MKINFDILKSLENDVMLDLTDEELNKILKFENEILSKFEKVLNINTDGVQQLHYCFEINNSYLRNDDETRTISKEDLLSNAPEVEDDYVIIKKVVG